jgi:segregation and condensation protein B
VTPLSPLGRQLEALLFLSPEPLPMAALRELTGAKEAALADALEALADRHEEGGLELAEVGGGFALRTRPEMAEVCDRLRERPPEERLTPAALETLAVVAYLEPVTRPEIGRLRGVAADAAVAGLVERGLLAEAGRAAGGAVRYRTTRVFQERFGLRDAGDLPPLERFELAGPEAEDLRRRLADAGHVAEEPGGGDDPPRPAEAWPAPRIGPADG